MVDWARHVIWWHVYPLGFLGAEPVADVQLPPIHRLPALERWLDHLIGLGANGLALGPVFASHTHGYDTTDHFRVDPRLGTEDDLLALIEACHARGVKVQLDGVFNHVGRGFERFQEVLHEGPASPAASWFRLHPKDEGPDGKGPDGESREGEREGTDGFGYEHFEGHRHLVTLNHDEPAVADHVASVMTYWCDRGVDAWRLDAAYAVPAAFWRPVLARVRERHPHVWVAGEMIHGDYAGYVAAAGLDSVTQYELWKAIWSSLNDRNCFELAHALTRHSALLETFLPQTFLGNHDVTRLASRLNDPGHLGHALAVLMTVPGVPSIYYGDELAWQGTKEDRAGGDDAVRPAYPPEPSQLPSGGEGTYELHQRLISVRRRNDWLNGAVLSEPLLLANTAIAIEVGNGRQRLLLALNLGDDSVRLPVTDARLEAGDATVHDDAVEVTARGWAVLGLP